MSRVGFKILHLPYFGENDSFLKLVNPIIKKWIKLILIMLVYFYISLSVQDINIHESVSKASRPSHSKMCLKSVYESYEDCRGNEMEPKVVDWFKY